MHDEDEARVVERTSQPLPVTTAGTNEALPSTVSPNHERNQPRPHDQHCAICDLAEFQGVTYASAHESGAA